ncbi:MAG: PaaI family thioesterase [Acidobacteriales bacterium]|nr:PaaI family thioesterase [Terriglobales bacterium]
MRTLGAHLTAVEHGRVEIRLAATEGLKQQHGYLHAGVMASVLDSACGYAALTMAPEGANVVSIEFKINMLSPALGEELIARAHIKRSGKNVAVCAGDAYMVRAGETHEKLVATMLATMMLQRG